MRRLHAVFVAAVCTGVLGLGPEAHAGAARTTYPVVFAHGMAGFDDILGYDYWGDDYGMFVGDACDAFLEVDCNEDIDSGQRSFVAQVAPFQSSEVRGLDLANDIEGFMATSGASKVNLIGHSQGGIDARKAARVLRERRGVTSVAVLVSVSSPHRGSPVAKYILDLKPGVTSVVAALAKYYGDIVYAPGNDAYAGAKQLVYNDYSSADGATTGMKAYNDKYPVSSTYAGRYVSLITAQNGLNVNPALYLLSEFLFDIDGDGYCAGDGDNDGAGGCGDGIRNEADDDGLVGINSQQMGYRLRYSESTFGFDSVSTDTSIAAVTSLNAPTSAQMTSMSSVISQDHLDVVGVGPDTFDEPEFYAAIFDYIAAYD
ncbi:triacylglycerol lipase [Myxococcus sp. RHSTA-1-4]|uniref:esterase/lipase family protein n=1 Tax=Myxococcus sp. RHSTA-1-4 TaxID=2874601 RepID=UPI001CBCEBD9|nr:acetyltransferase [Myxococcus sp. RHSTA-1-4]MBZ4421043.1 acetyltransferase [Myxococcus sp. RHSTA-1-4]